MSRGISPSTSQSEISPSKRRVGKKSPEKCLFPNRSTMALPHNGIVANGCRWAVPGPCSAVSVIVLLRAGTAYYRRIECRPGIHPVRGAEGDLAYFHYGDHGIHGKVGFSLQRFYVKEFAENLMMRNSS